MNSPVERYIGRGLEGSQVQELLSLLELGMQNPPGRWMYSSTWKLSKPISFGTFMEAPSYGPDYYLHFPLLSPENGDWVWEFQTSHHILVFLVTSPIQSPPRVTSLEKKMLHYPGNSKKFGSSVKHSITQEIARLLAALSETVAEANICIFFISYILLFFSGEKSCRFWWDIGRGGCRQQVPVIHRPTRVRITALGSRS